MSKTHEIEKDYRRHEPRLPDEIHAQLLRDTLRARISGEGHVHLPASHPGSRFRAGTARDGGVA